MEKTKVEMEYDLKNSALSTIWLSIGTPAGMADWFADDIKVDGKRYIFTWDKHEEVALLVRMRSLAYICFQWESDEVENPECYFELSIAVNELTGDTILHVVDFAVEDEVEETRLWWNMQIDKMMRIYGF